MAETSQQPQHYGQVYSPPAVRSTRDEVLTRLTRLEIAAWVGLGVGVITMAVVIYWTVKVYQVIHALQHGLQ